MTNEIFIELLEKGECNTVDYKAIPYFSKSDNKLSKDQDAEFVKDILAFTNTVRDESAYIILGVKTVNGKAIPIGIDENQSIDNSILQNKIKDKVDPIPNFSCFPFWDSKGMRFDIIEIPITWYSKPCLPIISSGGILEKGQIYVRRDSSNQKASYEETVKVKAWLDSISQLAQLQIKPKAKNKTKITEFQFDEETIQSLFGNEAAEDEAIERLKEYYFKNDIYGKITVDLPLRILVGHKGIGKSALFKVAIAEDIEAGKLPLIIKPDDVFDIAKSGGDFLELIRFWKVGIYKIITKKVLTYFGIKRQSDFLFDEIGEDLHGFLLGLLDVAIDEGQVAHDKISLIEKFQDTSIFNVYIDDLDRGWLGGQSDIIRISALLNAVRDISNTNRKIQFKISLRSDVYFLVRTSDESTDKIQSSVIWYKWTYNEILALLVKRVTTFFGNVVSDEFLRAAPQGNLTAYLTKIIEPRFQGDGKWENAPIQKVLLSVIRKRPRDLVKFLTLAARQANSRNSNYIMTQDLKKVFDEYSLDRIQDTINEYKSELPSIERLIFGMKPSKKGQKFSENFYFTTPNLLLKINNIRERGDFKFSHGKSADAKELAAFLYKINFITATKKQEDGRLDRKDFEENRYLAPKFEDFGYDWEVHMAYRWGLQPSNSDGLFMELL
jgi:hypothetical protein